MASYTSTLFAPQSRRSGLAPMFATLLALFFSHAATAIPLQTPGNFDPLFAGGLGKIASLSFTIGNDRAYAVALQPDGKIVLAGECPAVGGGKDFCLARLNSDGSPDASFTGPVGVASGKFLLPIGSGDDAARAVALQPDGKIIVAGSCHNGVNYDFCIARLNPNGSRDSSFGGPGGAGNGLFLLPIGSNDDWATAVTLQSDGKILLAGYCYNIGNNDFCAARLNADGTLDTTFVGPAGNGNGKFLLSVGAADDYASAMAVQADGRILLAGYCVDSGNVSQFCVARLNTDGTLDTTFDGPGAIPGNGKFLLSIFFQFDNGATAVVLQPDGNIVLTGFCTVGLPDFCAARLSPGNGALDASFVGPAGTGGGRFTFPMGAGQDFARGVALQSDGKLVLVGNCLQSGFAYFCAARLNGDGSLDTTFDGPTGAANGKMLLSIGTANDRANAVAIQPDGKIVVAGHCGDGFNDDFCIARLSGGPFGYKNCSMDIDGDGKVLATTDALLLARVALGVTGNAVVAGALGVGATRTTWTGVRDYLVSQCGMNVAP